MSEFRIYMARLGLVIFTGLTIHSSQAATADADCPGLMDGSRRLVRWQTRVRKQPPVRIKLSFPNAPYLDLSLLKLPYSIAEMPGAEVFMGYVPERQSLIPYAKDSGHAPFTIYIDGYTYVLTFATETDRSDFDRTHQFSSVLSEGIIEGSETMHARYPLILSPGQFQAMAERIRVLGMSRSFDGFQKATWADVKAQDRSVDGTTSGGSRYYFDRDGRVVAFRRERSFFIGRDRAEVAATNAASHAEILRRQGRMRGEGANRFLSADVARDAGLSLARREVDEVERLIDGVLASPNAADLAQSLRDTNRAVLAQTIGGRRDFRDWTRLLRLRDQVLSKVEEHHPDSVAGDLRFLTGAICRSESGETQELTYRFAWYKGLGFEDGAIVLSRDGRTLHYQLLALAFGPGLLERFLDPWLVRGGLIRLSYDRWGRIVSVVVPEGRMQIPTPAGPREVTISDLGRQTLALDLLNWCDGIDRPGSVYLGMAPQERLIPFRPIYTSRSALKTTTFYGGLR